MLERMFNAELEDPSLRRVQLTVRLMFAFSGIAFVDLAHLKWENIRDGILQYHRQRADLSYSWRFLRGVAAVG